MCVYSSPTDEVFLPRPPSPPHSGLAFGVELATLFDVAKQPAPTVVLKCIAAVESRGLCMHMYVYTCTCNVCSDLHVHVLSLCVCVCVVCVCVCVCVCVQGWRWRGCTVSVPRHLCWLLSRMHSTLVCSSVFDTNILPDKPLRVWSKWTVV